MGASYCRCLRAQTEESFLSRGSLSSKNKNRICTTKCNLENIPTMLRNSWVMGICTVGRWEVVTEIFLEEITPQLRLKEWKAVDQAKSGAGRGNADRIGSGNKCTEVKNITVYEEYQKRFIEAEVLSVKLQVWCHEGAPSNFPLRETSGKDEEAKAVLLEDSSTVLARSGLQSSSQGIECSWSE